MKLEFVTNSAFDRLVLRDSEDKIVSVWIIGARHLGCETTLREFTNAANDPESVNAWHVQDENGVAEPIDERFDTIVASIPREDGTPGVDVWELAAWHERCRFYGIDYSAIEPEPTTAEIMDEIDEILDLSGL